MKIALIQQESTADRELNRDRGIEAVKRASKKGANVICFAELAFDPFYPQSPATEKEDILYCDIDLIEAKKSHARRLFFRDRRPDLYAEWLSK